MKEKQLGKFKVEEHDNYSNILREATIDDTKSFFNNNRLILVDEVIGKNHFIKACRKAKLWNEADNPSEEKIKLNNQLIAIINKDRRWVSDDYYLSLSIKDMKKELERLQKIIVK